MSCIFFNDTATTEIYTLSLHDALPISRRGDEMLRRLLVGSAQYIVGPFARDSDLRRHGLKIAERGGKNVKKRAVVAVADRKSTRLNSSHANISYAVFCLKKKHQSLRCI